MRFIDREREGEAGELRVMHVLNSFARGGAELFVEALARELQRRGTISAVCAVGSIGVDAERPFRQGLEAAGVATFSLVEDGPQSTLTRARRLRRLLRSWRAHIVHLHTLSPATLGFVGSGALGVQSIHAGLMLPPRRWLKQGTEAVLARLVRRNIAVSSTVVADACRRTGLRPSELAVIPNGLGLEQFRDAVADPDRLRRAMKRDRADGEVVAVVIGRIDPNKGHDIVIDAVAELTRRGRRVAAVFAGSHDADPAWTAELRARIARHRLEDRVCFAGVVTEVGALLKTVELFISASRSESMSLTVVEAMAAGRPIIVSDIPPHRELTDGGRLGRLFAAGDPIALADAWDQTQLDAVAPAAYAFVAGRYSIAACAEHHLTLYRDLR